jgi:sulfoxide reductase heme-binding subunit YedZ
MDTETVQRIRARPRPVLRRSDWVARRLKPLVWLLCLTPLALLLWRGFNGRLTANPIEFITHRTGFWALVLLCCTLAITPLRRITGWNWLARLRRLLGLFAFCYATLHFAIWLAIDRFFAWGDILDDIVKRPYITAGFTAFVLLLPLAITSTRGWTRRLGRRWQLLHRLIYLAVPAAALHFFWKRSAKLDIFEPLLFASIVAALLLVRALVSLRRSRRPGGV